ncbi:hypothetical protein O6H91_07G039900 [Diphasiastrum complanatum]|uniref:Uncharacterized protein n=1 Tax=Diphasiastrum complanatum TaxID=34168 RepID=A0ACC2D4M8_DIPCM|nr:hypothetical protein O6H91_07G039900 [Diphasiastrum complanatum]
MDSKISKEERHINGIEASSVLGSAINSLKFYQEKSVETPNLAQSSTFCTIYKAGVQPDSSHEQFFDYQTVQNTLVCSSSLAITVLPGNVDDDLEGLIGPDISLIGSPSDSDEASSGSVIGDLHNHSVECSCAAVSSLFSPSTGQKNSDEMGNINQVFNNVAVPRLVSRPLSKNLDTSKSPPRVVARRRRRRISQRIGTLQRLVPGGTRMDTVSLLDETIHYVNFLKLQVQYLECLCKIPEDQLFQNDDRFLQPALPNLDSPDYNLDPLQLSSRAAATISHTTT